MPRRWSSTPPLESGRYLFRQVSNPQVEHDCKAIVYADGSLEIFHGDGDTLDNIVDYEFAGPLPKLGR